MQKAIDCLVIGRLSSLTLEDEADDASDNDDYDEDFDSDSSFESFDY